MEGHHVASSGGNKHRLMSSQSEDLHDRDVDVLRARAMLVRSGFCIDMGSSSVGCGIMVRNGVDDWKPVRGIPVPEGGEAICRSDVPVGNLRGV